MKRKLIIIGSLILCSLIVYLLYSYSFIEISVQGSANSEKQFSITSRHGDESKLNIKSNTYKKLVRRGSYSVSVREGDKSFLKIFNTIGFLRTVRVDAKLEKESARQFVGNNPSRCIHLLTDYVVSNPCEGTVDEVGLHVPANEKEPTFVKKFAGPSAEVQDIFSFSGSDFMLAEVKAEVPGQGSYLAVYPMNKQGVVDGTKELKINDLKAGRSYRVLSYREGLLIFSTSPLELLYYKNLSAKPEVITAKAPRDTELKPSAVTSYQENIIVVFANYSIDDINQSAAASAGAHSAEFENTLQRSRNKGKSEIVLLEKGSESIRQNYGRIKAVRFCGSGNLCIVTDKSNLLVQGIRNSQLEELFELPGVLGLEHNQFGVTAVRKEGVYRLDVRERSAFLDYAFGDYLYCGIEQGVSVLVVCIEDGSGKRSMLQINQKAKNSDSIDKKILDMSQADYIKNISIYGQYIFISPEVGKPRLNEATGRFEYDQARTEEAKAQINSLAKNLGIDQHNYRLISTIN